MDSYRVTQLAACGNRKLMQKTEKCDVDQNKQIVSLRQDNVDPKP